MATMDKIQSMSDPESVARKGEEIYNTRYRQKFEKEYAGRFVAIEILSEKAYIGEFPEQALEQAKRAVPDGIFHLLKVGASGAFKVGYTSSHANRIWLP